jgi:DNA ligase-1
MAEGHPQRLAAALARAQQQRARLAQGDDRHHGVACRAAPEPVAVPGDAVAPVAVVAQARGGELLTQLLGVVGVQCVAGALEQRVRQLFARRVVAQEAWDGHHVVVHTAALGAPGDIGGQAFEQVVGTAEPAREGVDPRAVGQRGAPGPCQLGQAGIAGREERALLVVHGPTLLLFRTPIRMNSAAGAPGGPAADDGGMLFADVARVSREVAGTSSRSRKTQLLADFFRAAEPDDAPIAIAYLAGRLPQGRLGVGWAALRDRAAPAAQPALTVRGVDAALTAVAEVSGQGAQAGRRALLQDLFGAATAAEQEYLLGLLTGEVRQGALDAAAVEGLAAATGADPAGVRRAVMLSGALEPVAQALLADGPRALAQFRLTVGRPLFPMLAASAKSVAEALARLGPCAVEEKLDGIRVQVHREGGRVTVFTRTLDDVTDRLPEVVAAAAGLDAEQFVLDGEVLALDAEGRPRPFQETAGRVGSRVDVATAAAALPVAPVFFDVLALEGRDLLDLPYAERHAALEQLVPVAQRVRMQPVAHPEDADELRLAEDFFAATLARGHEGVVVKGVDGAYAAGRRGASWIKVKPVHTLDLVVLAVEWGHGRRTGKLSNLHLGARAEDGSFVMLGKTFKGLTDALLDWQTEQLLARAVRDDGHVVTVRPELVVEVAYDGVQTSPRYPAGLTLRFARVLRYRDDKTPAEADTVETVRAAHTATR